MNAPDAARSERLREITSKRRSYAVASLRANRSVRASRRGRIGGGVQDLFADERDIARVLFGTRLVIGRALQFTSTARLSGKLTRNDSALHQCAHPGPQRAF